MCYNVSSMTQSFLQSNDWQAFQEQTGKKTLRSGDFLTIVHRIGPFRYAYVPRVGLSDDTLSALKKQGMAFARVEGEVATTRRIQQTHNRQPQTTLVLNLNKSETELLGEMHSKTRYNIRLAERKGVVIRDEKNVDVFWMLNTETTARDAFKSHGKAYYKAFIEMPMCRQYTAYLGDTPVASVLCVTHSGTTTYVHGASSNAHRNTMAPYLLQWHAISQAKESGDTAYDFWGIAPIHTQGKPVQETCYNGYCWELTHPWTGITRFKVGFGGTVVTYPQAVDVVLKPLIYVLYRLIHRLRYGTKT